MAHYPHGTEINVVQYSPTNNDINNARFFAASRDGNGLPYPPDNDGIRFNAGNDFFDAGPHRLPVDCQLPMQPSPDALSGTFNPLIVHYGRYDPAAFSAIGTTDSEISSPNSGNTEGATSPSASSPSPSPNDPSPRPVLEDPTNLHKPEDSALTVNHAERYPTAPDPPSNGNTPMYGRQNQNNSGNPPPSVDHAFRYAAFSNPQDVENARLFSRQSWPFLNAAVPHSAPYAAFLPRQQMDHQAINVAEPQSPLPLQVDLPSPTQPDDQAATTPPPTVPQKASTALDKGMNYII